MILQVVHCPHCDGTDIVRHGQTRQGKQRYCCREHPCTGRTFLLDYCYAGQSADVQQQIVEMALHASGIRDTARVLHVSTHTVMNARKKRYLRSNTCTIGWCRACIPSRSKWSSAAPMHWIDGVD